MSTTLEEISVDDWEVRHRAKMEEQYKVKSGTYTEIQNQLAERIAAETDNAKLKKPSLLSADSLKLYKKMVEANKTRYLDASISETRHMRIMVYAVNSMQIDYPGIDVGRYIEQAHDKIPMDPQVKALLEMRAQEEERRKEKAAAKEAKAKKKQEEGSKPKEIDGQLSIFKKNKNDDGSTAEAASEVVTKPIDQVDEKPAEVLTDEQWEQNQRELIHGFLTPAQAVELSDLFKAGAVDIGRQKLNELIEATTPKKGRNALFKKVYEEFIALCPVESGPAPESSISSASTESDGAQAESAPSVAAGKTPAKSAKTGAAKKEKEEKLSPLQKKAAEKKAAKAKGK